MSQNTCLHLVLVAFIFFIGLGSGDTGFKEECYLDFHPQMPFPGLKSNLLSC